MRSLMKRPFVLMQSFVVVALCAGIMPGALVAAQDATPRPARDNLDLAAMALVTADLPEGFGRNYGGSYYPGTLYGDLYATQFSPAEVAATGIVRTYEDFDNSLDAPITIGIFIDEYASAEGAKAGFAHSKMSHERPRTMRYSARLTYLRPE